MVDFLRTMKYRGKFRRTVRLSQEIAAQLSHIAAMLPVASWSLAAWIWEAFACSATLRALGTAQTGGAWHTG